ncbi:MAG TPA: response regulator transcription factor [Anaerolineae bacterium]|nr:response regulator transcription factor [Anaerolineae bacterium]
MNKTILIVDDEANIRDLAAAYLQREQFTIATVTNGHDALAFIHQTPPDLIILDLMLPGLDGWEVCRQVRATSQLPILMLTARTDDIDKIIGLELGADDYLTKPFNPRELVARVKAILRRTSPPTPPTTSSQRQLADLTIDPDRHEVTINGSPIELRAKEFDLLLTLIDHPNRVMTRDQLLNLVWGYDFYGNTRTVDVHIAHLREHLTPSQLNIETIWGKGYKLTTP